MLPLPLNPLVGRPDNAQGLSKTKVGGIVAVVGMLATIWQVDIDPRLVETVTALGGLWGLLGIRDALK